MQLGTVRHAVGDADVADTLAGHGQRLGVRIADDGIAVDAGDIRDFGIVIDQLTIGLVGNDVDRVAVLGLLFAQQGRQRLKLRARDNDAGGVIRGVQNEQRGLFRHCGRERLQIERKRVRPARHDAHAAARRLGIDGVLREVRREHDGLIPRTHERTREDRQRARRAVGHVNVLRAVSLAERPCQIGRDLFAHGRHARRGRVGVQLRGRNGAQQPLDGRVHTVRRVDARVADGKVIDVFGADLSRAALAVGRDLADGAAALAPVDHLFRDHAFASSRYCFRYKMACR